ncbi:MAG: D-alanyl-D-alanine carboxypeptidase, partial [Streptosporangiaceae bacterium]
MKRWKLLIATLVTTSARGSTTEPAGLTATLAKIQDQPRYQPSDWGYSVLDQNTGEVLAAQNADHLFDPGSTMKTYAVSTALRLYGSDYRFRTPVYRVGDVT